MERNHTRVLSKESFTFCLEIKVRVKINSIVTEKHEFQTWCLKAFSAVRNEISMLK